MSLILTIFLSIVTFIEPLSPAKQDTVWIGDQFRYGIHLKNVADSSRVIMPAYDMDAMSDSAVVVKPWALDTVKVRKRGGEDIDLVTVFTSFDSCKVQIQRQPIFIISPKGVIDTLMLDTASVRFFPPQIDTATFVMHDIKAQIKYPVTFKECIPYIAMIILLTALIVSLIAYFRHKKKKAASAEVKDPAHIVALRKIDKYRSRKLWEAEHQKEFYSGVTDALREYISDRYGVAALEMTTAEIRADLKKEKDLDPELKEELLSLFETADFIKFAKFVADDDQNAKVVPFAVRFVTDTYIRETAEEGEEAKK